MRSAAAALLHLAPAIRGSAARAAFARHLRTGGPRKPGATHRHSRRVRAGQQGVRGHQHRLAQGAVEPQEPARNRPRPRAVVERRRQAADGNQEVAIMSGSSSKPKFVYVTYIRTTAEKLWR